MGVRKGRSMEQLPPEVWLHIFSFLSARELSVTVAPSCRRFLRWTWLVRRGVRLTRKAEISFPHAVQYFTSFDFAGDIRFLELRVPLSACGDPLLERIATLTGLVVLGLRIEDNVDSDDYPVPFTSSGLGQLSRLAHLERLSLHSSFDPQILRGFIGARTNLRFLDMKFPLPQDLVSAVATQPHLEELRLLTPASNPLTFADVVRFLEFPPRTELTLKGQLSHLRGLELLSLHWLQRDDSKADYIATFYPALTNLTVPIPLSPLSSFSRAQLHFSGGISDRHLHALTPLTRLRILSINARAHISDPGFCHITRFALLQSLDLSIHGTAPLTDDGLASLTALRHLSHLSMASIAMTSADHLTGSFLGLLTTLRALLLSVTELTPQALHSLQQLTSLQSLHLERISVPYDAPTQLLCLAHLTGLRSLAITNCNVVGVDFSFLSSLQRLEALNLCWSGVTSMATEHFTSLTSLRTLQLARSQIGMAAVQDLTSLPNLEFIVLPDGAGLSRDRFVSLFRADCVPRGALKRRLSEG